MAAGRQAGRGSALEALIAQTAAPQRILADPLEFPRSYPDPLDAELVGLVASSLAYGRVDLFKPRVASLLAALGEHPAAVVREASPAELLGRTEGFRYRMSDATDLACLLSAAGAMQRAHGSLGVRFGALFAAAGEPTIRGALGAWVDELLDHDFGPYTGARAPSRRLRHLLPSPRAKSPCKRLNLYLRWMVRGPDAVDLGLWRGVPASALVVPLDTHVHRIARLVGFTRRPDASWATAEEITSALRRLDPRDPVRFDFALSHLGISGACPARPDPNKCRGCPLQPICGHWSGQSAVGIAPTSRRVQAKGAFRSVRVRPRTDV